MIRTVLGLVATATLAAPIAAGADVYPPIWHVEVRELPSSLARSAGLKPTSGRLVGEYDVQEGAQTQIGASIPYVRLPMGATPEAVATGHAESDTLRTGTTLSISRNGDGIAVHVRDVRLLGWAPIYVFDTPYVQPRTQELGFDTVVRDVDAPVLAGGYAVPAAGRAPGDRAEMTRIYVVSPKIS